MCTLGILLQWGFAQVDTKNISFLLRFLFNMFWLFFGHSTFSKLSIIWFISPVPTCLVHNCEVVWRFHLSDLAFTFVSWSNLLIPISIPPLPPLSSLIFFPMLFPLQNVLASSIGVVTNFIWSYLHQFFDDSHGLKASLKPLRRPFDWCQSCLKAINNGRDIKQINW